MIPNSASFQALASHTLFSCLNDDELGQVNANSKEIDLNSGETLFSQDQDANFFYFVVTGKMKLFRIAPSGNEKVIEIIQTKETFAEALMFMDEKRYPVTAEALEKTRLLSIRSATYYQILQNRSELCFRIMGSLCIRLHQRLQEIERLSLQNATDRLIHYLLTHTPESAENGYELTLDIPKRILASRLSMLPETFSRVLHKLGNEQIIDVNSRTIVISNVKKLRDYYQFSE